MDLQGQTVSHYRVLRKLGGGGMGVVYEAEDLRLRRHVALKFLPESLAHDQDAIQRFQREARAASSLNHPNICTIYEVEEYEGRPVIVMELMQGSTLKERLAEGPLPIDQLTELSAEMCDGLEAAHAQGIIHRDIKPANIFLTSRGTVKILDFGLAKLLPEARLSGSGDPVDEKESDISLTIPGVIHGTTSYMSPEQARGEELDRRTDLFSVGTVMYEMTTGQRAFARKNVVLTLDAILNGRPAAVSKLNPAAPPELEAIIEKALEKHREQRYQTAGEMLSDLNRLRRSQDSVARLQPAEMRQPLAANGTTAGAQPAPSTTGKFRARYIKLSVPGAVVLALALGGALLFQSRRAHTLSEKDDIVLADFDNKTDDPVFDETLKQALEVDLEQSPFLNIVSERKVTTILREMGHSPDQPVIGDVARELCERVRGKAMLTGSISSLGNNYVIGLSAIDCATGDPLVKQQVQVSGKEGVLKALGKATQDLRGRLGESLASVQKFATPIEEATTSSLEALKAYSMARRSIYSSGDLAGIPYYQRALELDPNFALAYRGLAVAYTNLGQATRASENAKRAFELRERVTEREKYAISANYYSFVTGELEKAEQVYELYAQSYPRDFLAVLNLGDTHMKLGEWEKALRESEASLRLEDSSISTSNLAESQLALNQTEQAKTIVEQAIKRNIDYSDLRLDLYETAFMRGDEEGMRQQLAWAAGRPGEEDWLLSAQSDTEAYHGRLGLARQFSRRAVDSALRADAKETAALWQVKAALWEAELGNSASARQGAMAAMALAPGRYVKTVAALALARAGDAAQAQKLADSLNRDNPQNTMVQRYWLPAIRAAIEIHRPSPTKVIPILQVANPYEMAQCQPFHLGMLYPAYLRGQSYLLTQQGKEAAAEFQKIVDHPGLVLNFPLGALARLGLAHAYLLQDDRAKARAAYMEFIALWKDADPDIPILRQAMAEYAKLK